MSLLVVIGAALGALARNTLRSLLTVLGVVIGIAAVIAMVAIGGGARTRVAAVFESMGTNLLIVVPGASKGDGLMGGAGSAQTLTWDDLAAIRTELSAVRWAAPVLTTRGQVASDEQNWNTQLGGTSADFFRIRSWRPSRGRLLEDADDAAGARVAVVGATVARELWGSADPVGQRLRIKGSPYEVVGVLEAKGQSPVGQDYDDIVYLPARTYQAKVAGGLGAYLGGMLYVSAVSAQETDRAEAQLNALLRDRHRIDVGEDDDFTVRNLTEFARASAASTATITTMLAAIAAVSLVVGGIGIMNIMLVSVVERTREIGVRMAVGARPLDVLVQFLVEALILSAIGGAIGLALGWLAASQVAAGLGWSIDFPRQTAALALLVSCGIGVGFGLYPAIRAARLDPITALRYEA